MAQKTDLKFGYNLKHAADCIGPLSAHSFSHPEVCDLAWVISSPHLLSSSKDCFSASVVSDDWCNEQLLEMLPLLLALDSDPSPLLDALALRPSQRLGLYFEKLVEFWLRASPSFSQVSVHLPVREGKKTLGEHDFVFFDSQRHRAVHWETAVKFYLRTEPSQTSDAQPCHAWDAFRGPGAVDTLGLKLNKIFNSQLPLSRSALGASVLPEFFAGLLLHQEAFVKGILFYPLSVDGQSVDFSLAPGMSPAHGKGWWCRRTHFAALANRFSHSLFAVLPRKNWLTGLHSRNAESQKIMNFRELLAVLEQTALPTLDDPVPSASGSKQPREESLMLAEFEGPALNKKGGWREISRGFVVSDRWPG